MPNTPMSNKSILLVLSILSQLFIVITVTGYNFLANIGGFIVSIPKESITLFLFVLSIILTATSLFAFNEIIELSKQQFQAKLAEQRLKDSQDLVQVLRAQQHDFMNHLQVLYSAAQLGKIELVDDYFEGIVKDVKEISSISKIIHPEIAALIYSKITKAEELTNKVNVVIDTNLDEISMSTIDLSRVIGNLLDNAIYALTEVDVSERKLILSITESKTAFQFAVCNHRPIIPEEILDKIFNSGFTTKGNRGSGLGLYNVKQIVGKYHGNVNVSSDINNGTVFEVHIPRF